MFLTLFCAILAFGLLYKYLTWNFDYWKKKGILGPKPIPLVGTFPRSCFYFKNFVYELDEIYREYREKAPFVGIFSYRSPELVILDNKLVSEIFVSKFKYFQRNNTNYSKTNALLFSRNPFVLRDEEWKENRSDISPAFTTMKIKMIYPIVVEKCKRLTDLIKAELKKKSPIMDTKEITAKFTADVICSVAYGLESNAIIDPNSEFSIMSTQLFKPSWIKLWFITIRSIFPILSNIYDLPFVRSDIQTYFIHLTEYAIDLRKQLNDKPDDYLSFLLRLKLKKNLKTTDIASHLTTYFLDAYETTSIVLTHVLYRLAQNKKCQIKLRDEIMKYENDHSFEAISGMVYLDQVFNETLRISPPGFTISKVCSEPIELINFDGKIVKIEAGTIVHIPIYSIHNDLHLYSEPHLFDPKRFSSEHCPDLKTLRDEGIFFPFGHGPRLCMGMRYSTFVIKAATIEIIKNFELILNERTAEPISVKPKDFLYMPTHNIFIDYKPINM